MRMVPPSVGHDVMFSFRLTEFCRLAGISGPAAIPASLWPVLVALLDRVDELEDRLEDIVFDLPRE